MTALRRTAQRKTADLSAVTILCGIALAVVPISVRAETKVGGAAAPQSTPAATVDNANRSAPVPSSGGPIPQMGPAQGPVPVPSSGGPIPPIRPAQGPAPVPTPPASGTTGPTPMPQIAAPAPALKPPQPGAALTPVPPRPTVSPAALTTSPAPTPSPTRHMWVAQLIGESSETVALSRFHQMQRELRSALGSYEPAILRTTLKDGTIWVRVRVEFDTRQAAEALCSKLESARKHCFVLRNSNDAR
jgi:hypothetical protein